MTAEERTSGEGQAEGAASGEAEVGQTGEPAPVIDHPGPAREEPAWEGKLRRIAPGVLLLAIPVLVLPVLLTKSMTADEYVHVPAGSLTLTTGSFRPNCEQPPLVKLLAAWPLRLWGVAAEKADPDDDEQVAEVYREFWYSSRLGLDRILLRARIPLVLISVGLGALVFLWARSLYGPWGGIISLTAYVFSPTILAHTGLVTTDLAGAAGFLLALRLFWGACRNPSQPRLLLLGASLGLGVLCKFSAILVIPALVIFAAWSLLRTRMGSKVHELAIHRLFPWGGAGKKATLLALAVVVASAGIVAWAGYGFEMAPLSRSASLPSNKKLAFAILASPVLSKVYYFAAEKAPLPMPSLIRGLDRVRKHNRHGHHAFFMGQRSREGWWTYFPVAFALKTSLPLLGLLGLALATCWAGRSKEPGAESLLLIGAAVFFLFAMGSRINIGIRHVLPVYPILCLLVGRLATVSFLRPRPMVILLGLILGGHAVEAIRTSPDYLAYFQPLTGGPSAGYRQLVDSNLDWGQDLMALGRDLERKGQKDIWLAYFGPVKPSRYEISYRPLPPGEEVQGMIAISATSLQLGVVGHGVRSDVEDPFGWLRRHEPFDHVGHSILYYSIPITK